MNSDHTELHTLLGDILVPANFRWVLSHEDNLLKLRIQTRDENILPWFKTIKFRGSWEDLRVMTAPTYGAMLRQLQEWPEFLEMYRASDQPLRRAAVLP